MKVQDKDNLLFKGFSTKLLHDNGKITLSNKTSK